MSGLIDYYLTWNFLSRLVLPFDQWPAYKEGLIDRNGNILIAYKQRNQKQKESLGLFDKMVRNLKRLLSKIPGGSSAIGSMAAAALLLREDTENLNDEELLELYIDTISTPKKKTKKKKKSTNNRPGPGDKKKIFEDAPANGVGGGQIAGMGVNNPNIPVPAQGEPGVNLHKKRALIMKTVLRRKRPYAQQK